MAVMTRAELENKVIELSDKVEYLERQLELKEKEVQRLRNRGAGRVPKFSDREKEKIVQDYREGHTVRDVAGINGCSVGYVHKLISEQNHG